MAAASTSPAVLSRRGPERPGLGSELLLRRGRWMPQLGLGGGHEGEAGRQVLAQALRDGYRLVDTALFYGKKPGANERDIAAAIRLAGLQRSDVFICTKLIQAAHASDEQVRAKLEQSLSNLGTEYVDLYLVHNPRAGRLRQVWASLLELRDAGKIRCLGVSNFGVGQLEGLLAAGLELPEVNQIELHCWRQLPEVVEYHRRHGIATMCLAPMARGKMFGRSDLAQLATELGRSEAQVAIRWSLQQGYVPIPFSSKLQRIRENAADGFDLSEGHMSRIAALDCGFMCCRGCSPNHTIPWELVAEGFPHPAVAFRQCLDKYLATHSYFGGEAGVTLEDYQKHAEISEIEKCAEIAGEAGDLDAASIRNPPEENRTYSSSVLETSRLGSSKAWIALHNTVDQWVQIDLGLVDYVSGIRIQKRADDDNEYVTQVDIEVSEDGSTWLPAGEVPFDLTYEHGDKSDVVFSQAVHAWFVMVKVKKWNQHISMRVGVLSPAMPNLIRWYRHVAALKSRFSSYDHYGNPLPLGELPASSATPWDSSVSGR